MDILEKFQMEIRKGNWKQEKAILFSNGKNITELFSEERIKDITF